MLSKRFGDVTLGVAAGGAPARASRAPVIRLSRTLSYLSLDDCDAYHNFRLLKDIKVPCLPITYTPKRIPGRHHHVIIYSSSGGRRSVSCHTRQPNSSGRRSVSGHTRQRNL